MTVIELIATLFGLACVALCIRQSIWNWPTGLVQVVLYAWVFFHAKLYSDFLLHIIYAGLAIYGWIHWLVGGPQTNALPINRLTLSAFGAWVTVALAGAAILGRIMHRYTDAALPYWDAVITTLSLVAQYLIARKTLENWLFWIAVDVLAVGVYFYKGLYITTGLYGVFLVMATMGWFAWRTEFRQVRMPTAGDEALSSVNSSPQPAATST